MIIVRTIQHVRTSKNQYEMFIETQGDTQHLWPSFGIDGPSIPNVHKSPKQQTLFMFINIKVSTRIVIIFMYTEYAGGTIKNHCMLSKNVVDEVMRF